MKRVEFSKEQVNAIQEQILSCFESAKINGEFNAYAFHGAIETSLDFLIRDGYLFLHEVENV